MPRIITARYLLPIAAPLLEDGAMLVEYGRILAVGTRKELTAVLPGAPVIDFGEAVLLPPMVNAHTHLELTHFPQWAEAAGEASVPTSFVDWILRLMRVRRTVEDAAFSVSLHVGLQKSLAAGTGAVGDILTSYSVADAYRHTPLRGVAFAEVLGRDQESVASRINAFDQQTAKASESSFAWGLSPHSPYTLSAETLDQVFAAASSRKLKSCIHLAESVEESQFLATGDGVLAERLYAAAGWDPQLEPPPGCSSVAYLCRQGRLKKGDLAVHAVQVDDADVALLKSSESTVVLCPRSNAALGVGVAPVEKYLAAGVPLALGTDSLASAPSLSLWDEIAFAFNQYDGQVAATTWLEMATRGGAKALGLGGRMGQFTSGREASFQVVALPQLPSAHDLAEALCTAGPDLMVQGLYLSAQNILLHN